VDLSKFLIIGLAIVLKMLMQYEPSPTSNLAWLENSPQHLLIFFQSPISEWYNSFPLEEYMAE